MKQAVQNNILKNSVKTRGASLQDMLQRNSLSGATLQSANQRPVMTAHPVYTSPTAISSVRSNQLSQPTMNPVQAPTVNGWSGLVGGQSIFSTPLVSQANSTIRATPASLITINTKGDSLQGMLARNFIPGATLQTANQRPVITTHPVYMFLTAISSVRSNHVSQPMVNAVQAATINGCLS